MNRLAGSTSPYLLQHADNPVDWYPWGEEAFHAARERDCPILLSIGYAACHWCHVMARESFEDPEIAELMNRWFVNVKVDREERPDVDRYYMKALQLFGEQGGWPLTMFLTPDGRPLWGGTYFPPRPRFGRPSFRQVIEEMARLWRDERDRLLAGAAAMSRELSRSSGNADTRQPPGDLPARVARAISELFDRKHGGLQGRPKFPMAPLLQLLWRAGGDHERNLVQLTLTRICQGGIWDHLEGGLARYSTDERWLVPHFEKMLCDNAQLMDNLSAAWLATGNELFRIRILETARFLKNWLHIPSAGLAANLDADSEGEEGRYYVWTFEELERIVPEENQQLFFSIYDITRKGNWEGRIILNRLRCPELLDDETERTLDRIRNRLREARRRRPPPERDDKILASWNGLAIAALARAGLALEEASLIGFACTVFAEVTSRLCDRDDRLFQSWNRKPSSFPATADGLAAMIRAALWLFIATDDEAYVRKAQSWMTRLERDYRNEDGNAFFLSARGTDPRLPDQIFSEDEATPNHHALIVESLNLLSFLTGKEHWKEQALRILSRFAMPMAENPVAHAALLSAMHDLTSGANLTLIRPSHPNASQLSRERTLIREAYEALRETRPILRLRAETSHMQPHPLAGMMKDGSDLPALVICRGQTCSMPVTRPGEVARALRILDFG
jgi:hypothetical protein